MVGYTDAIKWKNSPVIAAGRSLWSSANFIKHVFHFLE
jgi:hypothetical protein